MEKLFGFFSNFSSNFWLARSCYILPYVQITMSTYSCYFCLVKRDNLANINLSEQQMELRTHNNMIRYLDQNLEKSVCIENISNFFGLCKSWHFESKWFFLRNVTNISFFSFFNHFEGEFFFFIFYFFTIFL